MADRPNRVAGIWRALGPGLVTGAADDDPSGIATYSQAGAQFGYALTWTILLTLPFMAAIQIVSACIGWSSGRGLAQSIGNRLPRSLLLARRSSWRSADRRLSMPRCSVSYR
jgi:Mn2+/Fe2+ NRAMP family transporter